MSSKSVARSAGLRSIHRGRQVAAVSVGCARIPPTGRPVRSGLARWFRLYQFSSFPSVSFCCLFQFVCPSRSLLVPARPCSFVPACSCLFRSSFPLVPVFPARLFVLLVSRSALVSSRSFRLVSVRSRSFSVQFSFRSVLVQLSLFCARAFSRAGFIYIILAYIIH